MSEPPKKKIRCTNALIKKKLLSFMGENKDLALGTFSCPMGSQIHQSKWASLADTLAELGPSKSVDQWKTTWRDLKSRAKTNNAQNNRAMTSSGNYMQVPLLSVQDAQILSLIGRTSSEGILGVPESPIGLVPPPPPLPREILTPPSPQQPSRFSPTPLSCQPAQPPQPPQLPRPPRRSTSNLGEIYATCSEGMTLALTDISNHLKRRNEIEVERNEILREKNQIMLLMLNRRPQNETEEVLEFD